MSWRVEFEPRAEKDLNRLPKRDRDRILEFLYHRVTGHPYPMALAKRLSGTKEISGGCVWATFDSSSNS